MFHVDLVSEFLLDLTWTLSRGKQGSQVCINQARELFKWFKALVASSIGVLGSALEIRSVC